MLYLDVQVIAGKDKGTIAEVEKVVPTRGLIVVKGVNIKVGQTAGSTAPLAGVGPGDIGHVGGGVWERGV